MVPLLGFSFLLNPAYNIKKELRSRQQERTLLGAVRRRSGELLLATSRLGHHGVCSQSNEQASAFRRHPSQPGLVDDHYFEQNSDA